MKLLRLVSWLVPALFLASAAQAQDRLCGVTTVEYRVGLTPWILVHEGGISVDRQVQVPIRYKKDGLFGPEVQVLVDLRATARNGGLDLGISQGVTLDGQEYMARHTAGTLTLDARSSSVTTLVSKFKLGRSKHAVRVSLSHVVNCQQGW
jgi:hypothetical protein